VQHGYTNKQVALELQIKPGTVKIHLKHLREDRSSWASCASAGEHVRRSQSSGASAFRSRLSRRL
jgi:FixJ family two-component response regulator